MAAAISTVLAAVERHQQQVFHDVHYFNRCRRCDAQGGFKRHEARRRRLRVIVDATVRVLVIVLVRWRCSRCRQVFTDYPPFVLPYRRYACLLPLAREYLEHDQRSYQQVVAPGRRAIGYVTRAEQQQIDERALHRSTLWRFLFFLGAQTVALQTGLQHWIEHDPLTTLHRFVGAVAPHKYRSSPRGEILRHARRLLQLIDHWDRTFPEPFFPRFATRPRPP